VSAEASEAFGVVSEGCVLALATFLSRHHMKLTRLYVRLAESCWDVLRHLVEAIISLEMLTVLGLHLGRLHLSLNDFQEVASVLNQRISALHLAIPWTHPSSAEVNPNSLQPLVCPFSPFVLTNLTNSQFQKMKTLPLRYIHVHFLGRMPPLEADDLATDLPHLETIGIDRRLWTEDDGEFIQWDPRVMYSATEEDFRSEEHYWLYKYY
jgi:hypothetical protein